MLAFLFLLNTAFAQEKCTLAKLTDDCKVFTEAEGEPISFPDGTRIPTDFPGVTSTVELPSVELPSVDGSRRFYGGMGYGMSEEQAEKMADFQEKTLEAQASVMESLSGVLKSPKSILAFTSSQTLLSHGMALNLKDSAPEGGGMPYPVSYTLPWPPDAKDAKIRSVSGEDFEKGFLSKLSKEQREAFDREAKNLAKLSAELYQAPPQGPASGIKQPPVPEARPADDKRLQRLESLVGEAKDLLLSEISKGRSYEQLPPNEKALYDKIRTITYVPPTDPKAANDPTCQGTEPNAFYNPNEHYFTVCPNFVNWPDASLVFVIGHELAHSIDPCGCDHAVYRGSRKENRPAWEESDMPLARKWKQSPYREGQVISGKESDFRKEIKAGWLEEIAGAVPGKSYPYQVTMKCLEKRIPMENAKREDIRRAIRVEAEKRRVRGDSADSVKAYMEEVEKDALENPQCPKMPGSGLRATQAGEAMSDAWGAKVLGRYLEKNPPRTKADKVAAIGLFSMGACKVRALKSEMGRGGYLGVNHPYDVDRVNEIMLAEPRVQKALGCEAADKRNVCLRSLGSVTTPSGKAAGAVPAETTEGKK